jgi:hypothetical protein
VILGALWIYFGSGPPEGGGTPSSNLCCAVSILQEKNKRSPRRSNEELYICFLGVDIYQLNVRFCPACGSPVSPRFSSRKKREEIHKQGRCTAREGDIVQLFLLLYRWYPPHAHRVVLSLGGDYFGVSSVRLGARKKLLPSRLNHLKSHTLIRNIS